MAQPFHDNTFDTSVMPLVTTVPGRVERYGVSSAIVDAASRAAVRSTACQRLRAMSVPPEDGGVSTRTPARHETSLARARAR
jgi:hypothetical protein